MPNQLKENRPSFASRPSRPSLRDASGLLGTLRRAGAAVTVVGQRLHVSAPKGLITDEFRKAMADRKEDLLALLQHETRLLAMPLDLYAREGCPIEVRVPGLPQTLWWVPTSRHAAALQARGIPRGRIWTAEELRRVWDGLIRQSKEALPLARLKLHFDCELQSVDRLPVTGEEGRR